MINILVSKIIDIDQWIKDHNIQWQLGSRLMEMTNNNLLLTIELYQSLTSNPTRSILLKYCQCKIAKEMLFKDSK